MGGCLRYGAHGGYPYVRRDQGKGQSQPFCVKGGGGTGLEVGLWVQPLPFVDHRYVHQNLVAKAPAVPTASLYRQFPPTVLLLFVSLFFQRSAT